MPEKIFIELIGKYTDDPALARTLWLEIEKYYSRRNRYYHTIAHLDNMINELMPYRETIRDWDVLLFSIFYHDIVYNVLKHDNEEKSAMLAQKRLKNTLLSNQRVETCCQQILATKTHVISEDHDTNLFTDADLTILGSSPEVYRVYANNVRKEYKIYPDLAYNPGRKKVLQHFLDTPVIFKTKEFREKYEEKARENIKKEIKGLQKN